MRLLLCVCALAWAPLAGCGFETAPILEGLADREVADGEGSGADADADADVVNADGDAAPSSALTKAKSGVGAKEDSADAAGDDQAAQAAAAGADDPSEDGAAGEGPSAGMGAPTPMDTDDTAEDVGAEGSGEAAADSGDGDSGGAGQQDGELAPPAPVRFASGCAVDTDCSADETCLDAGGITYCAQPCQQASDCAPHPGGQVAACGQLLSAVGGQAFCRLTCDFLVDADCPGDMVCQDAVPFPVGTGTCGYPK